MLHFCGGGEKMAGADHYSTSAKLHYVSIFLNLFLLLDFSRNAVSQTLVRHLPGYSGPLPFELETGYVSVDDEFNDVQLFYYFVKSDNNPIEDPLVLWITGGPGCSALTAVAFEIGPLHFKIEEYKGQLPALELNPYSWTKVSNIIFLDTPVGTGFSYSRSIQGSYTSDTKSANQAYIFLRKWLILHPEFLSNPLYIGGDSYSGMVVPIIVQDISDGIEAINNPTINLQGYFLGNPVTDRALEQNAMVQFTYGMGILSYELFKSVKKNCGEDYTNVDFNNVECTKDLHTVSKCVSGVNMAHILEPKCLSATPKPNKIIMDQSLNRQYFSSITSSRPPIPGFECRSYGYMLSYYWANDDAVQKQLNIRKGTIPEWTRCNYGGIHYLPNVWSSIGYHLNLSKKAYRSLIYSGDHDIIVPFMSTQSWIRSLNYSISDDWRPWHVEGQVAGYTRTYTNNMTFATVKGGGHTAPEYKPKESFNMFKKWLAYEPL